MRHRVRRIRAEGPVDRHRGQRPVAGLPGRERQQRRGRRNVVKRRAPEDIGPQLTMLLVVRRMHPGPRVVTDPDVGQQHGKPGEVLDAGDTSAATIPPDRPLNLSPADPGGPELRVAVSLVLAELHQPGKTRQPLARRPRDRVRRTGGTLQRPREGVPVRLRGQARVSHHRGCRMRSRVVQAALRRAARGVIAEQGPVPAAVSPQEFLQVNVATAEADRSPEGHWLH